MLKILRNNFIAQLTRRNGYAQLNTINQEVVMLYPCYRRPIKKFKVNWLKRFFYC